MTTKAAPKAKRQRAAPDAPSMRKASFNKLITQAKASGEKIPAGVKHVEFREATEKERRFAKTLAPLARDCLASSV